MFFFILTTCLLDIVLILLGEILFWSLMAIKGLKTVQFFFFIYIWIEIFKY